MRNFLFWLVKQQKTSNPKVCHRRMDLYFLKTGRTCWLNRYGEKFYFFSFRFILFYGNGFIQRSGGNKEIRPVRHRSLTAFGKSGASFDSEGLFVIEGMDENVDEVGQSEGESDTDHDGV